MLTPDKKARIDEEESCIRFSGSAPIFNAQRDARVLNSLKVFRVPGHQRQAKSNGDSGNETVGQLHDKPLLTGDRLDLRGVQVIA